MEEDKQHKSFKMTSYQANGLDKKWWQLRKMDRQEYGKTAIAGLLTGYVFNLSGSSLILGIIGDTLAFAGLICGIVWIVLTIKERINGKNKTV